MWGERTTAAEDNEILESGWGVCVLKGVKERVRVMCLLCITGIFLEEKLEKQCNFYFVCSHQKRPAAGGIVPEKN